VLEILSLAVAMAIPQIVARAKLGRAPNSVGRSFSVSSEKNFGVDLDSTGCGRLWCCGVRMNIRDGPPATFQGGELQDHDSRSEKLIIGI
jgi:hypothetical protein